MPSNFSGVIIFERDFVMGDFLFRFLGKIIIPATDNHVLIIIFAVITLIFAVRTIREIPELMRSIWSSVRSIFDNANEPNNSSDEEQ